MYCHLYVVSKNLLPANSTVWEGLHITQWTSKGVLIQKSTEHLINSDFYPALQQPSQTHGSATTESVSPAPVAGGVILPLPRRHLKTEDRKAESRVELGKSTQARRGKMQ